MKFKIGEEVLLPRHGDYNPKFSRDIVGKIYDIRKGRLISYKIGKYRYLEELLRPVNSNAITLMAKE